MLAVWITVLIVGVTLLALLWGGGTFLQGYLYTEVSRSIFWQAPAAAAVLTLFYGLWCMLDYSAEGARAESVPYDTIFRFSAEETKGNRPVNKLWAVLKEGQKEKKVPYRRYGNAYYRELQGGGKGERWVVDRAVAIEVPEDGEVVRYDLVKSDNPEYRSFVSPDGWIIKEYRSGYNAGPTGLPESFKTGLWLGNLFLNFMHFALWFVCLWLLMRFQLSHALGLAFVLWLIMTVTAVPMMLRTAGEAAQAAAGTSRQTAWRQESPWPKSKRVPGIRASC